MALLTWTSGHLLGLVAHLTRNRPASQRRTVPGGMYQVIRNRGEQPNVADKIALEGANKPEEQEDVPAKFPRINRETEDREGEGIAEVNKDPVHIISDREPPIALADVAPRHPLSVRMHEPKALYSTGRPLEGHASQENGARRLASAQDRTCWSRR